ncbi:cell division protein FtsZ [Segetibacter sp. 3557_3]|uniref:cell division protein FtsZ n=1 Tax=Segetibacter sp. 3557_3 TaxID=2547429 RepID=UPI0010584945|nr:cell division protein FtsZ [Segetibacter sp. 3557_3]TDH22983.1 cell division protein FtsZ [Segetibacter sp. 3557_3]
MIHFDLPKQKSSILKVIGVGGGGGNAVNHMFLQNIDSVDFIICNTDAQALANSKVTNKIQLGPHLTQGLGAGANPEIGKQATEESLEEIKRILEVNTKMAFITAGMGGGTGTGGAPIISKICKDLGILTVGIVTTPFSNEGPKRMRHAEAGIQQLRENVDTLLVISNDKLRHQYGNLKVREAFSKADNILATASKCITDVITSNGQINVDFADVCTVMRNGGVAILGSAVAEGEDRAQRAIEDAVNSPLLNDSEIRGAKWILVNITSSEGEHEITMDEEDTIMSYLRQEAGEDTDVIKGIGFDETLGTKIGVTIIATGFEGKDPFREPLVVKEVKREEKIVMTLGVQDEEKKLYSKATAPAVEKDPFAPRLSEDSPAQPFASQPAAPATPAQAGEERMTLQMPSEQPAREETQPESEMGMRLELRPETDEPAPAPPPVQKIKVVTAEENREGNQRRNEQQPVRPGTGFLSKPSNIYTSASSTEPVNNFREVPPPPPADAPELELTLVLKDEPPVEEAKPAVMVQPQAPEEQPATDEADDQKRRAAERIQKLRNLSFNMNAADPNSEFEAVPAYIRRNMEMFGSTLTSVENFYSKYTVKTDENNKSEINSINTFLDGKKPD